MAIDPISVISMLGGLGGKGDVKVNNNSNLNNQISIALTNAASPGNSATTGTQTAPPVTNNNSDSDIPSSPSPIYGTSPVSDPVAALDELNGTNMDADMRGLLTIGGLAAAGLAVWYFMKRG